MNSYAIIKARQIIDHQKNEHNYYFSRKDYPFFNDEYADYLTSIQMFNVTNLHINFNYLLQSLK